MNVELSLILSFERVIRAWEASCLALLRSVSKTRVYEPKNKHLDQQQWQKAFRVYWSNDESV